MGIAPKELNGVVPYHHVVSRIKVLGHRVGIEARDMRPLVYAMGAGTAQAEHPVGIDAMVPVFPLNAYPTRSYLNLNRLGVSAQSNLLPRSYPSSVVS